MSEASTAEKWIARALLLVFAAGLALIVLLPSDGHQVLGFVERVSRFVAAFGPPYRVVFRVLEFGANIALFVPLGVLLPLVWGSYRARVLWATVLVGALCSIAIELVQLVIPGRVSSVLDVAANTLGTAVGVLLLLIWRVSTRPRLHRVRPAVPAPASTAEPSPPPATEPVPHALHRTRI